MRLIAVENGSSLSDAELVDAMLRLRAQVFGDRLRWQVECADGRERDEFDDAAPTYIMAVEDGGDVIGCVRLLPAIRTSMLQEVFAELLDGGRLSVHERMLESSRFCVARRGPFTNGEAGEGGLLQRTTRMLFAGIIEWGLSHGYDELVTATDLRLERLLKLAGWPMRRLGEPVMIHETKSVAGSLALSEETFRSVRPDGYAPLSTSFSER